MIEMKPSKAIKIAFGIGFFVYFLLSVVTIPALSKTPFFIKPDILLAMSAVCGVLCDRKTAAIYAIIFGTLCDITVSPPFHFSPVLFFLCAYFMPNFTSFFSKISVVSTLVGALPFIFARSIVGVFYFLSEYEYATLGQILVRCTLKEILANIIAILVTYFIMNFIVKKFRPERTLF